MTTKSISERIEELKSEAAQANDSDTVDRCVEADGYELRDSDTNMLVQPEELFPREDYPMHKYVETIYDSLHSQQAEGHVRVGSRRVFAQ